MLLGRLDELEDLQRMLAGLGLGRGFSVVVHGAAGIGKTALLDAAASLGSDVATVLRATAAQGESEMAFAALGELIAPLLGMLGELPARQQRSVQSALGLIDAAARDDVEVFRAVTALLAHAASTRPVLCVIDDVHWLDVASVDAVLFAAKRLRSLPVGFVFATRENVTSRLDTSVIPRMLLLPLGPDDAAQLVRATNPVLPPARAEDVVRESEGIPLALIEFAHEANRMADVPVGPTPLPVGERIQRMYGDHARELSASARTALLTLAVAEQAPAQPVQDAMRALGCDLDGLDEAVDSGLVIRRGEQLAFRHPLVRSAVHQAAGRAELRAVHRALAVALADAHPELAAWHDGLGSPGPDEAIASALERTAGSARRRGGRLAEARALELAARLSPSPELAVQRLLAAGTAAQQAGRHRFARDLLEQVVRGSADVLAVADAQYQLAQIEFWQEGRLPTSLLSVAESVEPFDRRRAARLLSFALVPLISDGKVAAALPIAQRAWALIDNGVEPFEVAFRAAHVLVAAGERAGADLALAAAAAAERVNDLPAMVMISQPLWWLEEYESARRLLTIAITAARESAAHWMLCHALINQAELERRSGRPVQAKRAGDEALTLADDVGDPMLRAEALVQVAAAEAQLGANSEARVRAEQALRLAQDRSAGTTELRITAAHALVRVGLASGRVDEATNLMLSLVDVVIADGLAEPALLPGVLDLLDALRATGRVSDAARIEAWVADSAMRCGRKWAQLEAARAAALRDPATNLARLGSLLEKHDWGADVMTARAWLSYGELLRRRGERVNARAALSRAQYMFQSAGAKAWYEQVDGELRACGVTGRGVPDDLTPQEERVARLAAGGARNREIAQRLNVSEKTVESHLAGAFRKFGIRSRIELAGRFPSD